MWKPLDLVRKALTVTFPTGQQGWSILLPRTKYDYKASVKSGENSSIVMSSIRWAQRTFPEAPIVLRKKAEDAVLIRKHDFLKLLDTPNPFYEGMLMHSATLADAMISGNAYWIKLRAGDGRPVQLWWAPSDMMEPEWPLDRPDIFISHYMYRPNGGVGQKIRVEDVVHFRDGIDPKNTRKGLSALTSLYREIFTDEEAANMTAALLRNMGVPGVMISPENNNVIATPAALLEIKQKYSEMFTGDHRGEPLVLTGPTKIQQFGFSPEQLDVKNLRRIPEERVSAVLGIPAVVAGLGAGLDRSTFQNYAEAREAAYESFMMPMQRLYASVLKRQLLRDFVGESAVDQWEVEFDTTKVRVLQEDKDKLATRLNQMVMNGWITVAEARQAMGDLEILPEHQVYLRQFSATEVPTDKFRASLPADDHRIAPPPPPAALPSGEEDDDDEDDEESAKKGFQLKSGLTPGDRQRQLLIAFKRISDRLEPGFSARNARLFHRLGRRAAKAWIEMMGTKLDPEVGSTLQRMTSLFLLLDLTRIQNEEFAPLYQGQYKLTAEVTFETINSVLGKSMVTDTEARAAAVMAQGGRRVGLLDVPEDTKKAMFQAIEDGRTNGESTEQIATRISNYVGSGRYRDVSTRSMVISRTETKHAQVSASIEAFTNNPNVGGGIMLVDAQLGPTDQECEIRNGRIVTADEARQALEAEHPNGTLSVIPVLE